MSDCFGGDLPFSAETFAKTKSTEASGMDREPGSTGPTTQQGLDMLFSLAIKEWETQSAAFDTVDTKSSSTISYVSLATGIIGAVIVQGDQSEPVVVVAACIGLVLLGSGVLCAFGALRTRSVDGLPEVSQTLEYLDYYGDEKTIRTLIETIEEARETLRQATDRKADLLDRAHTLVIAGFVCVVIGVLYQAIGV